MLARAVCEAVAGICNGRHGPEACLPVAADGQKDHNVADDTLVIFFQFFLLVADRPSNNLLQETTMLFLIVALFVD